MTEVVVDAKPMAKLPYDPKDIPEAVRKRAEAVNALYSQNGQAAQSNGSDDSSRQSSEAQETPSVPPAETPTPQTSTTPPSSTASAEPPPADDADWKLRYERMHGRYNASQKTIGEMQEQMTQLGNELLHLQRLPPQQQQPHAPPPNQPAPNYLTQEDVTNYGDELTNFAQRAALHAIAPELQDIRNQNAELQARLAKEARRALDQTVEIAVPNYREIDRDPRWHRWLLGIDVLSGRVRQQLLNEAIIAASPTSYLILPRLPKRGSSYRPQRASA